MNKKIAYIIHDASPWILTEIRALKRQSVYPLVCICNQKEEPLLRAEFRTIPSTKQRIVAAHTYFIFFRTIAYFKLLKETHAKIGVRLFCRLIFFAYIIKRKNIVHLHAHFATAATLLAKSIAELNGITFSFTAHAYDIFLKTVDTTDLSQKINKADFVRTVSQYHKRYIKKICPEMTEQKIKILSYGVDINRFRPHQVTKPAEFLILSIGNFVEKKGFPILIDACFLLKKKGIPFTCWIVGDGVLQSQMINQIKKLNLNQHIKLKTYQENEQLNILYNQADIFVLPCVQAKNGDMDGIPNVLIEAMATATPVISTSISGIPELIDDEKTGLLIPAGDSDQLAQAIIRLSEDLILRLRLGYAGREKVINHFNIDSVAHTLIEIFNRQ